MLPFTCKTCLKQFSLPSNLRMHQLTHTMKKSFSCETCSKKFSRADVLQRHLLTHTGENYNLKEDIENIAIAILLHCNIIKILQCNNTAIAIFSTQRREILNVATAILLHCHIFNK